MFAVLSCQINLTHGNIKKRCGINFHALHNNKFSLLFSSRVSLKSQRTRLFVKVNNKSEHTGMILVKEHSVHTLCRRIPQCKALHPNANVTAKYGFINDLVDTRLGKQEGCEKEKKMEGWLVYNDKDGKLE